MRSWVDAGWLPSSLELVFRLQQRVVRLRSRVCTSHYKGLEHSLRICERYGGVALLRELAALRKHKAEESCFLLPRAEVHRTSFPGGKSLLC